MSFSKPKVPKPPPVITGDTSQQATGAKSRLRKQLAGLFGRQSTILTGGSGAGLPTTTGRTLLGG